MKILAWTGLAMLALLLCGCVAYETVPPQDLPVEIAIGDNVRVTPKNGPPVTFVVDSVSSSGVFGGAEHEFRADQVDLIEKRELTTVGEIVGGTLAVGLIMLPHVLCACR